MTKAKMWDEVTDTLCNLDFIQAKACAKLTYDLVRDFNDVLAVIPDNAENIRIEKERQVRMKKYTNDLIAYSRGEIKELNIPKSITPWSEEKIKAEIVSMKTNPMPLNRLNDFYNFLGHEVSNLQEYALEFAHFAAQQAWNWADVGPVGKSAEKSASLHKKLFLRVQHNRPIWTPFRQSIKILKGHKGSVKSVVITPNGKLAISASEDNTCILWNLTTGMPIFILKGHTEEVNAVSITPDGKLAISASNDKTCILWNLNTGEAICTLHGHTDGVLSVSITPDGRLAASGSKNGTIIMWDLIYGKISLNKNFGYHWVTALHINLNSSLVFFSSAWEYIMYDFKSSEVLQEFHLPYGRTESLSISADDRYVLVGCKDSHRNDCFLWDLKKNEFIRTLKGHTGGVNSVSMTSDGKLAISGSGSSSIILSRKNLIDEFVLSKLPDKICILWDLFTGKELNNLDGHTGDVNSVSITPDGQYAISASNDRTCILWDLYRRESRKLIRGHNSGIRAVSVTPDQQQGISGSQDGSLVLWNLSTLESILNYKLNFPMVNALSITPDGKCFVIGSLSSISTLCDIKTGTKIHELEGHVSSVNTFCITQDGRFAISGSNDMRGILWDLTTGKSIYNFIGHAGPVNAVTIMPDNSFAVTGSSDNMCYLWDLKTGKLVFHLAGPVGRVNTIAIAPDGRSAITGTDKNDCILWNLRTGQVKKVLSGHNGKVESIIITPDGQKALSTAEDNTCILWDLRIGEKVACFISHSLSASLCSNGLFLGCVSGEVVLLEYHKSSLCSGIAVTTIRHIWDFEFNKYTNLLADCPLCGHRFEPPKAIIQLILKNLQASGIQSNQSPCMELPDEAWDEPGLLSNCPSCGKKLKFNPFFPGHLDDNINSSNQSMHESKSNLKDVNTQKNYGEATSESLRKIAEQSYNKGYWEAAIASLQKLIVMGETSDNILEMLITSMLTGYKNLTERNLIEIEQHLELLDMNGNTDKAKELREKLNNKVKPEASLKQKHWWKKWL